MEHIAIVEDEDEEAKVLISYIEKYAASTGQEFKVKRFYNAVDFLAEYQSVYAVVFMDIQMPIMKC